MKKEELKKKFTRLESTRRKLFSELENTDATVLHRNPAPGKWSIAQIVYHLSISEAQSVQYVGKKMLGGNSVRKTGLSAAIRSLYLKGFLLSGYKWKAPAFLGDVPDQVNYQEVILAWNEVREQLAQLIETIPEDMIDREIYRNPRAGRLNLLQMMDFFEDHFEHHRRQVIRLKNISVSSV